MLMLVLVLMYQIDSGSTAIVAIVFVCLQVMYCGCTPKNSWLVLCLGTFTPYATQRRLQLGNQTLLATGRGFLFCIRSSSISRSRGSSSSSSNNSRSIVAVVVAITIAIVVVVILVSSSSSSSSNNNDGSSSTSKIWLLAVRIAVKITIRKRSG